MTLTTHAVVGSVLGAVVAPNIAVAAAAGFASHFLMDSIPHWDYPLRSMVKGDKPLHDTMDVRSLKFAFDLMRIGFDFFLGFALATVFFFSSPHLLAAAYAGAAAAVLPDALQFVYFKLYNKEPLRSLQRFHIFMESEQLKKRPAIGVASQIGIIVIAYLLSRLI